VYVCGSEGNNQNRTTAMLWENGIPHCLTDGKGLSYATSVFVAGSDVYVAGAVFVAVPDTSGLVRDVATLWKNGKQQRLGDNGSSANSVCVSAHDVFVAGHVRDANMTTIATLWKNGEQQLLGKGGSFSTANSVFMSSGDVYVAGCEVIKGTSSAALWKNGDVVYLGHGEAHSVHVSHGDVYVAGEEINEHGTLVATLWKNGEPRHLGDGTTDSWAVSVYATGNNVYVAGYKECSVAAHAATRIQNTSH